VALLMAKVPSWASKAVEAAYGSVAATLSITNVSRTAIERVVEHPGVVTAIRENTNKIRGVLGQDQIPVVDDDLLEMQKEAETARSEVDSGFRLLHSNGIVLIWAYLETLVDDLLVGSIKYRHEVFSSAEWSSIKIPIQRLMAQDEDERARFVAQEASRFVRQRPRGGDIQLEGILGLVVVTMNVIDVGPPMR
jgi:hypothetical protein